MNKDHFQFMKTNKRKYPNFSQFVATDPSESQNFVFRDEMAQITMSYVSRFSYNLTIAIMDIRQIGMKRDEMR